VPLNRSRDGTPRAAFRFKSSSNRYKAGAPVRVRETESPMTNAYEPETKARAAVREAGETLQGAAAEVRSETKRAAKRAQKSAVAASGALAEAATTFARDARAVVEDKVGKARVEAERQYGRLKEQAKTRAGEADVFVHEKPYMALAAAALAGFLIGHLMSSGRSNVIYLRDDR